MKNKPQLTLRSAGKHFQQHPSDRAARRYLSLLIKRHFRGGSGAVIAEDVLTWIFASHRQRRWLRF